ncbi:hypothetical protein [Oleiagrimonas sp. C23AA]|uniref:hypothetical protein n=1 Tax=Oleiagrimonas sp. C23AA TaxID=2719047 RepID=UPI001421C18F|nr:hypothetical protein [Oleiagrimonas sp. C23AA]NII10652.1 hypothetical protein [Oleiagrimonas sp. C23AA]
MHGVTWIAPWRGTHRATAIIGSIIPLLCVLITAGLAIWTPADKRPVPVAIIAGGLTFLSAFALAPAALMARDAARLRIPQMARSVGLSMAALVAALALLAALVWGLAGADAIHAGVGVLAGLAIGLAWALLPRQLGLLFCFLPILISSGLWHRLTPAWALVHPQAASALAVMALLAAVTAMWRGFVHDHPPLRRFGTPMVENFNSRTPGWAGQFDNQNQARQLRRTPDWLRAAPDLRRTGPPHAERSVRVLLGQWYVPMRLGDRCKQLLPLLGSALVFVVVMGLSHLHEGHGESWTYMGVMFVVWFGSFVPFMLAFSVLSLLYGRWARRNAERSLLALLPGMGDAPALKRAMLRAALRPPLRFLVGLSVVPVIIDQLTASERIALPFILTIQAGTALALLAGVLTIFSGRRVGPWTLAVMGIVGLGLVLASLMMPLFTRHMTPDHTLLGHALLALAWAVLATWLAVLSWRGWKAYQRLPHPCITD